MKYMTAFLIAAMMMISGCGTEDTNVPINSDSENTENKPDKDENGETTYLPEGFNFETRTVKLNSGYDMPIIGIGTYLLTNSQAEESVYNALKVGMRLIDTADIYGNEVGVGRGIRRAMNDFGIKREDIFVTSKLWTSTFAQADDEIDERLERLGLYYLDLLLLHHTAPNDEYAYQAMERGVKAGKIHSIGISNFYEDDIDRLMKIAKITPAVIQNETHPYHQSRSVKQHIAPLGTIMESWFPLGGKGTGIKTLSQHEVITSIGKAHNKSPYQVLLRWQLQSGNIAIPGSTNASHIAEDFDIFDFELTPDDMKRIDDLDQHHRFASY
ncbi:MAG: aldo/keto reductase [Muribaculaceae bacterium]|nr:aldo/keto reductase [Muribaculaceae bacterium]